MKRNRPVPLRILSGIFLLILTVMFAAALCFRFPLPPATASQPRPESLPPAADLPETISPVQTTAEAAASGDSRPQAPALHILLIGQDRREGETRARSDAMILCSFLPDQNRLVLTSFLRDLYLKIPGHGDDRLNAAYAYGGMALLRQTLEENFELSIDGCIEVDFDRFPKIVDALGGVEIPLRRDEARAINEAVPGSLTEGTRNLTGDQALAYTRIRNLDPDGDFSRTARQRRVLTALLQRLQQADLLTVLSISGKLLPMLNTDMQPRQLTDLAKQLYPMLSGGTITGQRIPSDGTFTHTTIRDMAVLTADLEQSRLFLKNSFLPESTTGGNKN